jgi:hypothetical protein
MAGRREDNRQSTKKPPPAPYKSIAPVAQLLKALLQMAIGTVAVAEIMLRSVPMMRDRATKVPEIGTMVFSHVGLALGLAAAVELAYTLFTHGPDEALDPLMLGVAAALLIQLGQVGQFDYRQGIAAALYVGALAGLFAIRRKLADDIRVEDFADWWKRRKISWLVWREQRRIRNDILTSLRVQSAEARNAVELRPDAPEIGQLASREKPGRRFCDHRIPEPQQADNTTSPSSPDRQSHRDHASNLTLFTRKRSCIGLCPECHPQRDEGPGPHDQAVSRPSNVDLLPPATTNVCPGQMGSPYPSPGTPRGRSQFNAK